MVTFKFKDTATYQVIRLISFQLTEFLDTFGCIVEQFINTLKYIIKLDINIGELIRQCSRFAFDSLPISLSIVGMTSIIISIQVAPEMVKQGGGGAVGALISLIMTREMGTIMAGFAIISMIGAAFASEIATMKVTDQINAMEALKVSYFRYLFVPRVLAGVFMMPVVVLIASAFGIFTAGWASVVSAKISWLNYINSVWYGLFVKDILVATLKASCFGFAIALISCSCGIRAKGGAQGVGIATTQAVVWSFIAIVIIDYIFALGFYF
ncbi:ABC transporter permease [bacterium]|nr:ABC transporter permease [bacterium]